MRRPSPNVSPPNIWLVFSISLSSVDENPIRSFANFQLQPTLYSTSQLHSLVLFLNNHSIYTYLIPIRCLAKAPKTYIMNLLG